jgi:hypothetical protein
MKIRTLGAELSHVDGRTDMTKITVAFLNFANASKKIVQSAHTLFLCVVFISEQTATCALHNVNVLVFMTEMKGVYCAVRTGSCLNSLRFVLKGLICHVLKCKRKVKLYIYAKSVVICKRALLKLSL